MAVSPPVRFRLSANLVIVCPSVKTHAIRNVMSARISIPAILVPSISENPPPWRWRTPLEETAPYWTSTKRDSDLVIVH